MKSMTLERFLLLLKEIDVCIEIEGVCCDPVYVLNSVECPDLLITPEGLKKEILKQGMRFMREEGNKIKYLKPEDIVFDNRVTKKHLHLVK